VPFTPGFGSVYVHNTTGRGYRPDDLRIQLIDLKFLNKKILVFEILTRVGKRAEGEMDMINFGSNEMSEIQKKKK
jgi:hypothetical protein